MYRVCTYGQETSKLSQFFKNILTTSAASFLVHRHFGLFLCLVKVVALYNSTNINQFKKHIICLEPVSFDNNKPTK